MMNFRRALGRAALRLWRSGLHESLGKSGQATSRRVGMIALLGAMALGAWGQGRQAQQAPATPATAPGRGGRGGVPGPGPAVGGDVDETPVVTHHSIQVNGKTLNYTATAAQMPLKDSAGETEAHIFYVAYTLDGVADAGKR